MRKFVIIATTICSLFALAFVPNIQAQEKSIITAQFPFSSLRLANHGWHHRLAETFFRIDQPQQDLAPPNLVNTLTEKLFLSFNNKKTDLFEKRSLSQKRTIPKPANAEHSLSGDVQVAWVNQYGSQFLPSEDMATDIAVDHAGNVYVTGSFTNQPFGTDYFTVKYNAAGMKIWEARYNGENNDDDFAAAIFVDTFGNVYVTGGSKNEASSSDYVTIKYGPNGATKWVARYDWKSSESKSYDVASAIAVDDSGNVYVTGWSENSLATVKYNSAGVEQWAARHQGLSNTAANAIAVDKQGGVYIAGQCNDAFIALKYSSVGQKEWEAGYSDTNEAHGIATALAVDSLDEVYVTGMYEGLGYPQYLTIKCNAAGAREWASLYQGLETCNWNIASALALDDSGNVYVTGESGVFNEDCASGSCFTREDIDYATIKYNRAGERQWVARHGPDYDCSYATAIKVDRVGNVYVTGSDHQDYATIKYDAAGRQQWITYCSGADVADNVAAALAIDGAENVYVTGWSERNDDKNYATVKYNSAGFEQWVARESGPESSFDIPTALALDKVGNIYVTGASQNVFGRTKFSSEWTTIKYTPTGETNWTTHGQNIRSFQNVTNKITIDATGDIYVIGSRYDLNRLYYRYGALAKYNRDGKELWNVAFDSTEADGYSLPTAITIDLFGNLYVTGSSNNADFTTIKYDATGRALWMARDNPGHDSFNDATAMALDDSGNVYVAGLNDGDGIIIKYNPDGVKQWMTRYHSADVVNRIVALAVEPLPAGGNIYILANAGYYSDYVTIKYNRAGEQQWETRYSRPGNSFDHPATLAVDGLGNVYVTGEAGTIKYDYAGTPIWSVATGAQAMAVDESGNLYTTGYFLDSSGTHDPADFFTVKYNSSGRQEWSARYDGPGNSSDYPVAIALDHTGNVYVTGQSRSDESQHWSYFTTIKYTQNAVAVADKKPNVTARFGLSQNYPNPFNPSTKIHYSIAQPGLVTLKIFDLLGREVVTLVNEIKPVGEYDAQWTPVGLPSGVYVYRLQAGYPSAGSGQSFVESKKLILMQ